MTFFTTIGDSISQSNERRARGEVKTKAPRMTMRLLVLVKMAQETEVREFTCQIKQGKQEDQQKLDLTLKKPEKTPIESPGFIIGTEDG